LGFLFSQQGAAQSAGFQRGEHVRIKAPTKPFSPDFLLRIARTSGQTPHTVPDGHYFVMGEALSYKP
jgi:hypothetical protein